MKENNKKQLVVNLFSGPGSGKSIACADIFSALKKKGINCEMAREYAKDIAWQVTPANGEKIDPIVKSQFFRNQKKIFGEQSDRQDILRGKLDAIVTDSPLLLSIVYDVGNDQDFKRSVINEFKTYNNYNFFLNRVFPYEEEGRYQNEEEAKKVDVEVKNLLEENGFKYKELDSYDFNYLRIAQEIYTVITGKKN